MTAAWIDYANRTGETVLGQAAKTIPEDLVDDLMDVCKHHAKLPITDCSLTFKFNPIERKQLIASLLRFSDELDVDGRRVSIETVKNFSLDPGNSIYWWLHNRTKVVFSARNVIILTIRLHADDAKKYGSIIHEAFITEFHTKNRPVLSVLARDGIPIVISDDSKVVEHDRAERLPIEIVQVLEAIQHKSNPLIELAEEVRIWLRAIRYEVSDLKKRDEHTADMVAILEQGTVKQRVLVRCIGGEITSNDVNSLDESLDRKTPQGWLISDKRVSDGARKRAAGDDAFRVFNLSDFLQQMVWGPYFDALKALVEKSEIPNRYVDLKCYKQVMDANGNVIHEEKYSSLDHYIDEWLTERGKMHISLLGEFGAGKTWFCRYYAYMNLTIWSLPSFNIVRQITGVSGHVIDCSPDGTTIAVENFNQMSEETKDKKGRIPIDIDSAWLSRQIDTQVKRMPELALIDVDSGRIKSLNYSGYYSSPAISPDGNYLASAGRNGDLYIWDISPASSTFAQCLKVLEKKISCHGMLISGAHGLEQGITIMENGKERKGMLLELFADCGAVLDEEQKRNLKEMRK